MLHGLSPVFTRFLIDFAGPWRDFSMAAAMRY
jgi:hypothetical protein